MTAPKDRELLAARFVATFDKLDEMLAIKELDPIAWELASGEPDKFGYKPWKPAKVSADRSLLDSLYAKLPAQFPRLFESLILSYRWAEVDLGLLRLVANPPGADLSGLFSEMSRDPHLWDFLLPRGYIRFGKGADMDYDPVCFDISSRRKNGDYSIVKIDHEEILCNNRLRIVAELSPSFEELVRAVIDRADRSGRT